MKVLFISHDASRNGAQILFLNLLRWLKKTKDIDFEILLKQGGELENEFAALAKSRLFSKPTGVKQKFFNIGKNVDTLLSEYKKSGFGLIYSNTITNGDLLEYLSPLKIPVITHVHELENYIVSCGEQNFAKVDKYTTLYIVASNAVKENLVVKHGVRDDRVKVVHAFIPTENYSILNVTMSREKVMTELSIPSDAFVVGSSGTTDWRKSPDLFLQLAGYVKRNCPGRPIFFLWVGGELSWELNYDIEKLGLDNIRFVKHTANTADYFNCMDIFALVSRIDPYPLVCLEAASMGKPVICFDKAGGMPEFVESDCGLVVPYLSLEEMSAKIMMLYEDRNLLVKLGLQAQKKVRERHDVQVAGNEILALIKYRG